YTAENDLHKLLGRPGQYTSKVNFQDTRLQTAGNSTDVDAGGSVEVFPNDQSAANRKTYITGLAKGLPALTENDYLKGGILLRISKELTADQAGQYEAALSGRQITKPSTSTVPISAAASPTAPSVQTPVAIQTDTPTPTAASTSTPRAALMT